jgi:hypothetical protein
MDQETLWKQYSSLPSAARHQVTDFIAFLRAKYAKAAPSEKAAGALTDEPFIGMWQDRDDMTDSTAWVRSARKREWHDQ